MEQQSPLKNSKRSDAHRRADQRYKKKITRKGIDFKTEEEADLLEFISRMPNFSQRIKDLLREMMEEEKI